MRLSFWVPLLLTATVTHAAACDLWVPKRYPTLPEQIAGLEEIYGGTVVGYEFDDGTRHMGRLPAQCLDDDGGADWVEWKTPDCTVYFKTVTALFRVDVPIVGPSVNAIASYEMTWGDGDCNIDFEIGDEWLVAGSWFTQPLRAPIRESEIAILRRLAAKPAFDFRKLYE